MKLFYEDFNVSDSFIGTKYLLLLISFDRHCVQLFHDRGCYHIETSSLICSGNQWTGFYNNGYRHERVNSFFISDHSTVRSMDTAVKLNQLIHERSKESPLIMVNLPKPPSSVDKEFLCIFSSMFLKLCPKIMKIYGFVKLLQHPINTKFFHNTAWKVSKYGDFSGPYFPVFGLNTEIYGVNLRIQSEYRKIRIRKNSVFGHFSRSVRYTF